MKDSGVEWLGEVPEHWGMRLLNIYLGSAEGELLVKIISAIGLEAMFHG